MEDTQIRKLAIRYFEGAISPEEEKALFAYIHSSPEKEEEFRQWEQEWAAALAPDYLEEEWGRMRRKMERASYADVPAPRAAKRFSLSRFWRYPAAAAVLLLVAWSLWGFLFARHPADGGGYYTVQTANGERSKVVLADGTSIWLNAGSTLRYGSRFDRQHREVELDGEAYFEVARQQEGTPFRVKTQSYDVVVKGTRFNVSSYGEDRKTTTSLLEGSIDIVHGGKSISVAPGEAVELDEETGRIRQYRTDAWQSTSWMAGDLVYDRISLKELAARLSRKYDVPVRLDGSLDGDVEFRIALHNGEDFGHVLAAIARIIPVEYRKDGDAVVMRKRE